MYCNYVYGEIVSWVIGCCKMQGKHSIFLEEHAKSVINSVV